MRGFDLEGLPSGLRDRLAKEGFVEPLSFCFYVSNYLSNQLLRHPEWIEEFFLNRGYLRSLTRQEYMELFANLSPQQIRSVFRKEHVRLGIRDLLRAADTPRVLRELSHLADGVIGRALEIAFEDVSLNSVPPEGPVCCVVALGKLGGEELNYYSDVDVMYVYRKFRGRCSDGRGDLEFFTRVFSKLGRILSEYGEDGPIYHVDLRLRPQGRRGLLCMPVEAYEAYYESFGRTWERAMLIRSRLCAGDSSLFDDFFKRITPFVYRKHLDFSALEEIRQLKEMIDREAEGKDSDIKVGRGGIREIEFIVQAFQLVFGGRNDWLRVGNLFLALDRLKASGLIGYEEHSILSQAYAFYRKLENRLQMMNCTRTHALPAKGIDRVATSMGYQSEEAFLEDLEFYRSNVRKIFEEVMETPEGDRRHVVYQWRAPGISRVIDFITREHREKAEEVLYRVMEEAQDVASPSMVIKNLADLIGIMKYSKLAFFDLFLESPGFRRALIRLFGNSQYLSRLLLGHPELMDTLFEPKGIEEFPKEDLERWVLGRILYVGVAEVTGRFNIFRVFSEHSKTAEVFIREYCGRSSGNRPSVVVLALGKLGSRELTYHSDLDLVFVGEVSDDELYRDFYTGLLNNGVYEVDVRLRPFGSKGVMVNTPDSLGDYFSRHGRTWERLAYSRARVVYAEGEALAGKTLEIVRDFVFSGDLSADEVWDMRMRLERDLGRSPYDVKYSSGGLVDLEFAAQFLAITEGIDVRHPLGIFARACKMKRVADWDGVRESYLFLRRLENLLRLVFYPPLKELPRKGDRLSMLARAMGMGEHELVDKYMEVKEYNRGLLKRVLDMR